MFRQMDLGEGTPEIEHHVGKDWWACLGDHSNRFE